MEIDDKILDIFRKNDRYISGEEISKTLGVSRAAIWKHIEKLRHTGYEIVAQPHLGYRLIKIPDKMFPNEIKYGLNTKIIGKQIFSYNVVDSTMDIACRLAEEGKGEGTIVIAERQRKGRGRLRRHWVSPEGKGIYFSMILRPKIMPIECSKITITFALAIAQAIRKILGLDARIRWPNDILIDGDKVCGILTEMSAELDRVIFIVVGIGINVNSDRSDLPKGATSTKIKTGHSFTRIELLREVFENLENYYMKFIRGHFEDIICEWQAFSSILGHRVRIATQQKELHGFATDLDKDGALVLRLDNGLNERIFSGDVVKIR